eukprot:CAMPEP_0182520846 /NCGR_PEP_ID=MMETSP1321-20130603/45822_1 /TAXON_ID=91990 /ORGANISM="Bolidomonas sp., Strain RCC1657" /LENGTH=139 /DNA_ID=CAMNT_0024728861 /DNA_START=47 /DNA_END=464 /DNA_ORIENTATION=-
MANLSLPNLNQPQPTPLSPHPNPVNPPQPFPPFTPLPPNISPYSPPNPSLTSSTILSTISKALSQSLTSSHKKLEIEFPPLLLNSKSNFDDFDNIQELDLNKDFTVKLASFNEDIKRLGKSCWLLYPDLKELETTSSTW